jgi:hypothetical protein
LTRALFLALEFQTGKGPPKTNSINRNYSESLRLTWSTIEWATPSVGHFSRPHYYKHPKVYQNLNKSIATTRNHLNYLFLQPLLALWPVLRQMPQCPEPVRRLFDVPVMTQVTTLGRDCLRQPQPANHSRPDRGSHPTNQKGPMVPEGRDLGTPARSRGPGAPGHRDQTHCYYST